MSRLEEALRRAGKTIGRRETFNAPSARALDWFPADGTPATPVDGAEEAISAVADLPIDPRPVQQSIASRVDAIGPTPVRPRSEVAVDRDQKEIGSLEAREKLIVNGLLPSAASEQYRRIAGLLHHLQQDRGIHVVMVASATPGEGKTLTAVNLALTFSESYQRRVLLIDADLRRPMLHTVLGVENNRSGLSALLRGPVDYQLKTTHISDRLEVAPSGAPDPDPMSGLTSDRMRRVVADAASRYDWVILDTPPVALLPDASLLAAMVDVAVLVVSAGRTPLALVQKAVDTIGRDRITGVVLNRVTTENMPAEAYKYGYYYAPAEETRG